MGLLERLQRAGPKRILALDGGGIRGTVSLGYLKRIEHLLRDRHNAPDLVLADYFDLIGGTSTGAIIAAALAIGMSADKVERIYLEFGGSVFGERKGRIGLPRLGILRGRYSPEPLRRHLKDYFQDITLEDSIIRTGLCIVAKRADTNSTWPLHNHPAGRYFKSNRQILLRRAVRASTAAPTYFDPEAIDVGGGIKGAFVDGGVSLHNNPALLLFLIATLKGFPFRWPIGEHKLLLVSVGTGQWDEERSFNKAMNARLWDWASTVPSMLMDDATWLNQLMLQYLAASPTATIIDSEVGGLEDDLLGDRPALTYLRYNARLEAEAIRGLGLPDLAARAEQLRDMSRAENRFDLNCIGAKAAQNDIEPSHFPDEFNVSLQT